MSKLEHAKNIVCPDCQEFVTGYEPYVIDSEGTAWHQECYEDPEWADRPQQ